MRTIVPIALWLAACSSSEKSSDATSGDATATAPTGDDDDDDIPTPDPVRPAWVAVHGQVVVVAGGLDPAATVLGASYYLDDLGLLCQAEWPIEGVAASTPPENEPLLTWWEVELGPPSATCPEQVPPPEALTFGLGAYDPRLDVALAAQGLDAADPYGLYVDSGGDEVWIVGVAGTTAQLAGQDGPRNKPPLPDGTYELVPLILAPCCD